MFTWSTRVNEPMPSSLTDQKAHVHLSAAIVSNVQDCKGSVSDVQPPGPRMLRDLAVLFHPSSALFRSCQEQLTQLTFKDAVLWISQVKCQDNRFKSFKALLRVFWFTAWVLFKWIRGPGPISLQGTDRFYSNILESHSPNIRVNPMDGELFGALGGAAWGSR